MPLESLAAQPLLYFGETNLQTSSHNRIAHAKPVVRAKLNRWRRRIGVEPIGHTRCALGGCAPPVVGSAEAGLAPAAGLNCCVWITSVMMFSPCRSRRPQSRQRAGVVPVSRCPRDKGKEKEIDRGEKQPTRQRRSAQRRAGTEDQFTVITRRKL